MILRSVDGSARSVERVLGQSNLVLFFSLPFQPVGRSNLFLNGHIALGMEGTVYQVYDPKLLKADFLFSRMPAGDWLFGSGGPWVDRTPSSPRFTHVYLYGKCESERTVVYCAGIELRWSAVQKIKSRIGEDEDRFGSGNLRFDILTNNCSSLVASALGAAGLVEASASHRIPARLFKSFVTTNAGGYDVRVGKVSAYDASAFALHRYCIGAGMMQPEKAMDRWVAEAAGASARALIPERRWAARQTAVEAER
jgi:hypothetical protein